MDSEPEEKNTRRAPVSRRSFLACCAVPCAIFGESGVVACADSREASREPKEARFYEKLGNGAARCGVCPRRCTIPKGERGFCGTRENRGGVLYSLVYGRVAATHVDPIEKKPFFHFLPGAQAYSLATVGCNFTCKFCQNYEISQARPEDHPGRALSPEMVAAEANSSRSRVVAFTYNEPTVFTEFARNTAAAAKKAGLRSVVVSNGFINPAPLEKLAEVISGYKVDFKAFSQSFYREVTGGDRAPVLATIKLLRKLGVWTELVHLTIPTLNDRDADFRAMGDWLMGEVGPDVPVHFTRFHPMYRLTTLPVTPVRTLERARDILRDKGMHFVYIGNVPGHPAESTHCPKCGKTLIERLGYRISRNAMKNGACGFCGAPIPGVWS